MSMKNSNDTIGNRTCDLSACSAVPQPTAPPRAHYTLLLLLLLLLCIVPSYGLLAIKESVYMSTFSLHAATVADRLLWSYFLPPHLSWAVYHDFVRKVLPYLLQDVDLQTRIHLWFVHDRPPPHFLLAFGEFEQRVFGTRLGRGEHGLRLPLVEIPCVFISGSI